MTFCATKVSRRASASAWPRSTGSATRTIPAPSATPWTEEGGRAAIENLLQNEPSINVVDTLNEPAAAGAVFTYGVIAIVLLVGVLWYVLNQTA